MKPQSPAAAQCAANIDAVLRRYQVPVLVGQPAKMCLAEAIIRLIEAEPDRCRYFDYCPWAEPPKIVLADGGSISTDFGVFYDLLQFGLTPDKFIRYDLVQNHGPTARIGWREIVPFGHPSLQIIRHVGPDGSVWYEIDVDLYPPYDLARGTWHLVKELVWTSWIRKRKTDPFRVARLLREKRGIAVADVREAA